MPILSVSNYTKPLTATPTPTAVIIQQNHDVTSTGSLILSGIGVLLAVATLVIAYLQLRHHMRTPMGDLQSRYMEGSELESITVICLEELHGKTFDRCELGQSLIAGRKQ